MYAQGSRRYVSGYDNTLVGWNRLAADGLSSTCRPHLVAEALRWQVTAEVETPDDAEWKSGGQTCETRLCRRVLPAQSGGATRWPSTRPTPEPSRESVGQCRGRHQHTLTLPSRCVLLALSCFQLHLSLVETAGGMGAAAERLVELMEEEGEAHLRVWAMADGVREVVEPVAIAVQRGTALSYIHGYEQTLRTSRVEEKMRIVRRDLLLYHVS